MSKILLFEYSPPLNNCHPWLSATSKVLSYNINKCCLQGLIEVNVVS